MISGLQSDKLIKNKGTNPMFRSTRTNAPTGHLIFCDQSAMFLNDHKDFFTDTLKPIIKNEVNRRARSKKKSQLATIGNRQTTGKRSSIKFQPNNAEVKKMAEFGKRVGGRFEKRFNTPEKITLTNIFNNLITYIPQKKEKSTTAGKFCRELINNLNNPVMLTYLRTLAENCSFWVEKDDEKLIPIVFPERVRRHEKKDRKYKYKNIDHRGFRNPKGGENPIRDIAKKNPKPDEIKPGMGKGSKGMKISRGIYTGKSMDYGFEACHIWYDTTEAPPLFTFIPNVTWLPRIISRLSDEEVKNDFFPPLLKSYTKKYYDKHSGPLQSIVNGCWKGLEKGDKSPINKLEKYIKPGQEGAVKNNFSIKSGLRRITTQRIVGLLKYIDTCIKREAPDSDPLNIPKRQLNLFGGEEKLNQYRESYTTSKQKPTHKNSNLEGGWTREFLEHVADQQGINLKSQKFEDFKEKFKPGYRNELKQLIESLTPQEKDNEPKTDKGDDIELKIWLNYYYTTITNLKDKKELNSYINENEMDLTDLSKDDLEKLSIHFNIDETAVKRNVKEMLEEEEAIDKKKQAEELKKIHEFVVELSDRNPIQPKK